MDEYNLNVKITGREYVLWEGEAVAVSSENSKGCFDILPEHAKFITIIKNKPIIIHTPGGNTKEFKFKHSIIHVFNDKVSIFLP